MPCRAGRAVHTPDACSAELHAGVQAVDLAAELGAIRIAVETDYQELEFALNNPRMDFPVHAVELDDLKMQMRTWFSSCTVQHCRREANSAANALDRLG